MCERVLEHGVTICVWGCIYYITNWNHIFIFSFFVFEWKSGSGLGVGWNWLGSVCVRAVCLCVRSGHPVSKAALSVSLSDWSTLFQIKGWEWGLWHQAKDEHTCTKDTHTVWTRGATLCDTAQSLLIVCDSSVRTSVCRKHWFSDWLSQLHRLLSNCK